MAGFNRFDYAAAPPASDSGLYQVETIAYQNSSKTINTNLPDPRTVSVVAAYHAAHPGIKVLLYRNPLVRNDDPNAIGTCTSVANTDPTWYLHNADGSRVYQPWNNGIYFADIANPAFQAACAAHTVAATKANGYDGIFLDVAMSTRLAAGSYPGCPGGSFTCSNNLAYDLAATSFSWP